MPKKKDESKIPAKKKVGRPTIFTQELTDKICKIVATNPYGLPKLCAMFPELPSYETIRVWRWENKEFSAKYAEAKRFQAEIMAESIEDIIDETMIYLYEDEGVTKIDSGIIAQARLRVDSRKWTASKLAPKIYGDNSRIESKVTVIPHEERLKDLEK